MNKEEKKESIDAEVIDNNEEVKTEKKDNAFKSFFKKTKASVDASILESHIESTYNKNNTEYQLYTYESLFSITVYGHITDNTITFFGELENKDNSIALLNEEAAKPFFIRNGKHTTVHVVYEGVEYERPATVYEMDSNVTEIKVIKAGKRYFLFNEENN